MIREVHGGLLFLGNALDARNLMVLYDHRIEAVVDLAINEPPAQLARDMVYCRIPIGDGGGNPPALLTSAISGVVMLVESGLRTLVACSAGMSRAPAIAATALAAITGRDPDECLVAITQHAPHDVSPVLWSDVREAYNQFASCRR